MITLIHGDDIVSSRKFLIEQKSSSHSPITLDAKELTFEDLIQTLKSNSLFSDEKNIFIEGLFSRKKSQELEKIIELIRKNSNLNITIWEDDELSRTQLSAFPKAKVNLFKIPKTLFSFLDNLAPKSNRNVLNFHEALKTADEDMLFYLLIRQFRLLLSLSGSQPKAGQPLAEIDEIQRLTPWQKNKLQNQSKLFTTEDLKKIYSNLYEIDLNIKTGVYPNLTNAIDFLLLDI